MRSITTGYVHTLAHTQGAQVAQQFFLSRILPNLSSLVESCPKSLQEAITKTSNEATEALHHSP